MNKELSINKFQLTFLVGAILIDEQEPWNIIGVMFFTIGILGLIVEDWCRKDSGAPGGSF